MGKVLILTAVTLEARAIARALLLRKSSDLCYLGEGRELHVVGIGAKHLPEMKGAAGVILAGLGGGLDPALKVGDVVVAGLGALPAELTAMGVRSGTIASVQRVMGLPEEKAQLFAATGAMAVEMESDTVRKVLGSGTAFVHVRGISDGATDEIDPRVMGLVDEFGRTKMGAVAGALLGRPGMVPGLLKLKRDSENAAQSVAQTVVKILESGWPGVTG